jgi:hypothetical protein
MLPFTDTDKAAQVVALRVELGLDDLVPIDVFAAALGVCQRTVERAVARGELRAARIGNIKQISKSHARRGYLASRNT